MFGCYIPNACGMKSEKKPFTIEGYIASFPAPVRKHLEDLRTVISKAAPGAEETISYGMPAFRLRGTLVYFAAQSKHIGFYPTPSAIEAFKNELSGFKCSKGAVQFPYDKPLPYDLITRMVIFRVRENLNR